MGIAIVGFAMVADVLRPGSAEGTMRLYTLRDVAEIGLIGTAMSAFPMVVHGYGLSDEWTWRITSGLVIAWSIGGMTTSARRRGPGAVLSAFKQHQIAGSFVYLLIAINMSLALVNLLNPGPSSGVRHATGMLAGLTQAGIMFILAVFDLRDRESAA